MIVDCHVHCKGGDLYRREFSAEEILRAMDEAGIAKSIVFAMCLPSLESQSMIDRVCSVDRDRLIPFAHVLPDEGPLALIELERAVSDLGFRGLKAHVGELTPGLTDVEMADVLGPIIGKCGELDVPCLLDSGARPGLVQLLASQHPETKLIIAHLGASSGETLIDRTINIAATHENLYLDTAYNHVPWKIADAIRRCGAHKVVWGSDGPLIHPGIELKKIEVLGLPSEVFRAVTRDNILRLIGEDVA